MRIVYVYDGDWPKGATRVKKQTISLAEGGHEVLLLSRNETRQPRRQREPWMAVRRLPSVSNALMNRALNFPLFFSPVWLWQILDAAREFDAELLLVEDLPLAPSALLVARLLGLAVVYDMGEVYPEYLAGLGRFKRLTIGDRVLRNPGPARWIERMVLARSDHVFVVSEESRDRAVGRGARPRNVSIVGNTPERPADLTAPRPKPALLQALGDRPVLLFVGILISDRGLDTCVRALPIVHERVPDAALVVVGEGPERERMEAEVRRLGLDDDVCFAGWQEHETLPAYYQHAHVGLLPFRDGGQIRFTLANKLFDYLGAGLPVVASDVPPMRRILSEAEVGRVCSAEDPRSLGEAIAAIVTLPREERARLGREGVRLVNERYHWALDAKRMLDGIERATTGQRG